MFHIQKGISYSANSYHKCSKTQLLGLFSSSLVARLNCSRSLDNFFCVCKQNQLDDLYFTMLSK